MWWFSRSKSHIVRSEMHYKNSKGKKKFKRIPSCLWWNKTRFKFRILSFTTSTIFSFRKAFEGGFPLPQYFTAACIISRFKCSQNIASLNVLMMLTVSMTVSHLYQNLENIKSVRSLKQASEVISPPKPQRGGGVYRVTLHVYRNN